MSTCDNDCSTCSSKCEKADFRIQCNKNSKIDNIYAIISGKGGVGKSLVTSLLAVSSVNSGKKTAILDADITGPSIPKSFGIVEKASGTNEEIFPNLSRKGIEIMSANLLLNDDCDPVIMRGPIIAGMVKQFYSDVNYGHIDNMFIDCPPGTGDVPLTVFQSIPVKGIIIVTSPQELVSMIVKKAVNMAQMMNIPILGIVENMSYFKCPTCNDIHYIYGKSDIENVANEYGIKKIVKMPINPELATLCDAGDIESYSGKELNELLNIIESED